MTKSWTVLQRNLAGNSLNQVIGFDPVGYLTLEYSSH